MRRHGFLEKDADPAEVYSHIKKLLESEGFKVTSEVTTDDYWDLHARKSGLERIVLGKVRDVDAVVAGTKGKFEVQLRAGVWGKDLAIPAIESVATFGAAAVAERRSAQDFEEGLWEEIVNKIDPSLFICEIDGLLFDSDDAFENHLKMHKQADLDVESTWNNAMTLTEGGTWV